MNMSISVRNPSSQDCVTTGVDGPEMSWKFQPGEFKILTQRGPGVPDPTLSRSLKEMTSRDPFQPSFCCDSVLMCTIVPGREAVCTEADVPQLKSSRTLTLFSH